MLAVSHTSVLRDTVAESFSRNDFDGVWYPADREHSLVRIHLAASGYQIERRRKLTAPWMPVVTASAAEFDPDAFRVWVRNWQLVA